MVTGSRDYPDLVTVRDWARSLPPYTCLMEGEARGVDQAARDGFLESHDTSQLISRPAQWSRYGRAAGPTRNQEMVHEAADMKGSGWEVQVVAFWNKNGPGTGTPDMIRKSRCAGLSVEVRLPKGVIDE